MGNLRGKTTDGFLSPLGIPQLSYPSPPSYFTSLRTGSYSYAAASSCEPRTPDGDKAGKTGNADALVSLHGKCVPWVRSWTRAARFRVAAFLHSHEMGHCPVSFPLARSRLMAAFLLSHPCGGCMAYLMERECRIHKDKEPQGSSPYAAVAGATIPVALGKADRHQRAFMEHACHEPVKTCCKSELHASALRRSYIPMKWGIARYRSRLHAPALWRRSYFPTLAAGVWYI